ncbi:MAG: 4'-phosphopantetheinyl transferase superfamily protein [Acidobacteria bacterium]|nr:4'-phosphopantetheinyl transferase superfamily protein [Acidobacteriota bacterium]
MFPRPTSETLTICWTDVRALTGDTAARWAAALPDGERARFARFKHERSAHEFLVGRLLVRQWLAALTGNRPNDWQFVEGFRGRPEIAGPATSLRFNIAHSGGVVACILTDGREAGVDVEDLGRRLVEPDLWHRYCAPSEIADIEAQPQTDQHHRFLTYWTLKEAYLKARGLGIGVHLADIAFHVGAGDPTIHFHDSLAGTSTDWAFGMTKVREQFLVSWATPQAQADSRPMVVITPVPLPGLDPVR